MGFIDRHGLWNDEQVEAAEKLSGREGLDLVRVVFADQHGLLRGKTVTAAELPHVLRDGTGIASSLLAKDTSGRTVVPVFGADAPLGLQGLKGAADMLMVPDPTTFRALPWVPGTGWLLCDLYFADGTPVPLCSRGLLRRTLDQAAGQGLSYVTGLELEFHLYRLTDPALAPGDLGQIGSPGSPPEVAPLFHGHQYLSELRFDEAEPVLAVLHRELAALGLPVRTLEIEFGPSQVEVTLQPGVGLETADSALLLRSAVKQVARRHGYHATFMCRPHLPQSFSSGWHLHQSLLRDGEGVFTPEDPADDLSTDGRAFLGGLLDHARGASAFSTPTLNGYKRYQPNSLAPDRCVWGRDNRGAMVRVVGHAQGQVRLENRVGEPAANPYLYLASQLAAGLDGMARGLDPGPSVDEPYAADAPPLPRTLGEALDALDADSGLRSGLGDAFVDYYLAVKRSEVARFERETTDWEQREYFRMF
ncbi:glutamine synthetase family protein [Streptomyces sp. NPDC002896]|uniref:glutamine synthetase family protein n=1 Tax=Streptomyces sp. NPDC002896 TaxID=3154438 RepID=UPI00332D8E69